MQPVSRHGREPPWDPRGPPQIRQLLPKRAHRRAPHACDECRLRKRGCDAAQPCGPCSRSGTRCTYQFRRPVPRPTSRIRTLQDHLRQAHGWLQTVKDTTSGIPGLDLDECLRILDFTVPETTTQTVTTTDTTPTNATTVASSSLSPCPPSQQLNKLGGEDDVVGRSRKHSDMLARCPRFVQRGTGIECFYGSYSDVSFILRTIDLLDRGPSVPQHRQLCIISDMLGRPLHHEPDEVLLGHDSAYTLPDVGYGLINVVLSRGDLMLAFLPEQELKDAVAEVQTGRPISNDLLFLLHMCFSLGYLYSSEMHHKRNCELALRDAARHFRIGMSLSTQHQTSNLHALQAMLCAITFLMSGFRCTSAHALIGTAYSLALRLGLFSTWTDLAYISAEERRMKTRLLATFLSMDAIVGLILDLPAFLHHNAIPQSRLLDLALEAEAEADLMTAAILRQSILLATPLRMRAKGQTEACDGDAQLDSSRHFQAAYKECQRWKMETTPLMTKMGDNPEHRRAVTDLEMTLNLSQIMLFRPHLHYLSDMYAGKTIFVAESYYALTCIKAASSAIVRAEENDHHCHYQQQQEQQCCGQEGRTHSWLSLYTIFSSSLCLAFLVAAHPATTLPSVAWQRACRGIEMIAAYRCADNIAVVCLELLKMVTHALSETIYIDFERIEATTTTYCNPRVQTAQPQPAKLVHILNDELTGKRDEKLTEAGNEALGKKEGVDTGVGNEVDRVLEQAEALPVTFDPEDPVRISDTHDWGSLVVQGRIEETAPESTMDM